MGKLTEYFAEYGKLGFDELPLNECDIVAFAKLAYVQFEKVASGDFADEPEAFAPLMQKMRFQEGGQYLRHGLWLGDDASRFPEEMGKVPRYAGVKVLACRGGVQEEPALQYGVQTYLIPDGPAVIAIRGTDDSIFGWKEDFDILAYKNIPSYPLAISYIEEAAEKLPGDLIVAGHSKGGNVALYAATHVSDAARARIRGLYNFDGPGFWDARYLNTPNYLDLLDRYHHFVPQNSTIGLMLLHDDNYKVAHSDQFLGVQQHDLTSWMMDGTQIETLPALSLTGRFKDEFFRMFIAKLTPEQLESVELILRGVIRESGTRTLLALANNAGEAVKGAVKVWKAAEPAVKEGAKAAFSGTGKLALAAYRTVQRAASAAAEVAADLVRA